MGSQPPPTPASSPAAPPPRPVFGFILLGGSLSGALVRDVRLANEMASRGFEVHVWWAMDRSRSTRLDPAIRQHWLFHGLRFWSPVARPVFEGTGQFFINRLFTDRARQHWIQTRSNTLQRVMRRLTIALCEGVEKSDPGLVSRFAADLKRNGVTHVLPMLEMLCPWVDAARRKGGLDLKYLVTFQGYELYSTYARAIDLEAALYARLVETVEHSDWPAIAVSQDYLHRVVDEVGVAESKLVAIPPGVPPAQIMTHPVAQSIVGKRFPEYDSSLPLVSYLGRRDTEKGIDLLLYAAALLRRRGVKFQVAVCGPTLWGDHYSRVCRQIAEELRCPVLWRRFIPDDARTALFRASRCVVYPSIHREPFGMVAAEVAAHGTPVIVPDYGGVASAIEADGRTAGIRFKVWDSGDLADQIQRLLEDDELHASLATAGPPVARHFSVQNLGDRVLRHLGLPLQP